MLLNVSITCIYDSLRIIIDETHGEKSRGTLRLKCSQYLDRAEELKKHLSKPRKKEKVSNSHGTSSHGTSSHKKDKG